MRIVDLLECHTEMYTSAGNVLTKGKVYEITRETPKYYIIFNDDGDEHHFTKYNDGGESYKTWFIKK
jgi:hypothetical protein